MKASEEHSTVRGNKWQIQDAGTHLTQVVDHALHEGPQTIIMHGKPAAVVLSAKEFQKLSSLSHVSLVEFFKKSPLYGVELDLERSKEMPRKECEFKNALAPVLLKA